MSDIPVNVEPEGEFETPCSCCGRPIFWGHGWLMSDGKSLAAFWYRWSEGHLGRLDLAIARFDENEHLIPGVASISAEIRDEALHYGVNEPEQLSWPDFFESFGGLVARNDALRYRAWLFTLVDAIAANDQRLSSRILASGLRS